MWKRTAHRWISRHAGGTGLDTRIDPVGPARGIRPALVSAFWILRSRLWILVSGICMLALALALIPGLVLFTGLVRKPRRDRRTHLNP